MIDPNIIVILWNAFIAGVIKLINAIRGTNKDKPKKDKSKKSDKDKKKA